MTESDPDPSPNLEDGFLGFLTIRCAAPGCPCYITGLHGSRSLELAWAGMRQAATEYGWVCIPWAKDEGPHYCRCDHEGGLDRDPR